MNAAEKLQEEIRELTERIDEWDSPPTIYLHENDKVSDVVVVSGDLHSRDSITQAITMAIGRILTERPETTALTVSVEALTWFIDSRDPRTPEEQKASVPPSEIKLMMTCTAQEIAFCLKRKDKQQDGWIVSTTDQARGSVGDFLQEIAQMVQPLLKEATTR